MLEGRPVYTLKLRQGVKFHDGSEMTSNDVKATYDKIVFPPAGIALVPQGHLPGGRGGRGARQVHDPLPAQVAGGLVPREPGLALQLDLQGRHPRQGPPLVRDERDGHRPVQVRRARQGLALVGKKNPDYWDKGKPYLDGFRAIFISASSAQVAAIRGERAHIQFRGFSPADRDGLVQALGPKITVQESAVELRAAGRDEPRQEAVRGQARPQGPHAGPGPLGGVARTSRRIAVVKEVGGVQIPGTHRHAAGGAREARRLRP